MRVEREKLDARGIDERLGASACGATTPAATILRQPAKNSNAPPDAPKPNTKPERPDAALQLLATAQTGAL